MTDEPERRVRRELSVPQQLELGAIGFGALALVWGFLGWWGAGGDSLNGYRVTDGYVPIALILTASLVAALNLRPADRSERVALLAIGLSGLGVVFTIVAMTVKPALIQFVESLAAGANVNLNISIQVGLILTLLSGLFQLAGLVGGWAVATDRLPIRTSEPAAQTEAAAQTEPAPSAEPSAPVEAAAPVETVAADGPPAPEPAPPAEPPPPAAE